MDYSDKLMKLISDDITFSFEMDLNEGIVSEDIIDKSGYNFSKAVGLSSPFEYDYFIMRAFDERFLNASFAVKPTISDLSCASLLNAYKEGKRKIELNINLPTRHVCTRLIMYLYTDETTHHVCASVYGQDITEIHEVNNKALADVKKELYEIDNILSCAEIGIWKIELFDGQRPKMYGTDKLYELIGVVNDGISPEALYIAWNSRIKKSSLPMVDEVIADMIEKGKAETTYKWVHPERDEVYVRMGGTSYVVQDKGVVLRGYHYDVTDVVTYEAKQNELLAEALSEAKHQKQLLQHALDDYKQADYDRRTDFLTGLRNRQDMFELLHDSLSGKREDITAMFMMDIDNFKMLNDHYGHTYGDECLKAIGSALIQYGKENNMFFYRYGGEEILGIGFAGGKPGDLVADEIVKLIYNLNLKRDDLETGRLTVSLGWTGNNRRYEKMIDKADNAMYKAKSTGKNKAVCYEEL